MNILLIGAGAVGVFYASKLVAAGKANLTVLARSDAPTLAKNGGEYRIVEPEGEYAIRPRVLTSLDELDAPPDVLLVALKVNPSLNQAELCRPAVGPNTLIVVIENGIGNEEVFRRAFPDNEIMGCVAYVGAGRIAPAVVRRYDSGRLIGGAYPPGRPLSARARRLAENFRASGVPFEETPDIVERRWIKLLWNAPYNTICVLGRSADTVDVMACPETEQLSADVMREVIRIAASEGVTLDPTLIQKNLDFTRSFAAYKPSTLQDFEAGRPMEVEAILGAPLRVAARNGVEAPRMTTLYSLMKLIMRKKRD